jgi:hypothetical protein
MNEHFSKFIIPGIYNRQQDFISKSGEIPKAILFLDGHQTRRIPSLWKEAGKLGIDVFVFPSHTTHLIQPLDRCPFAALKQFFFEILTRITCIFS